jgi:hypothetical protein
MSLAASLLYRVSSELAHSGSLEDTLIELTNTLGRHARLDRVSLTIEDPHRGLAQSATYSRPSPDSASFIFKQELAQEGFRYGQLEILASQPALGPAELYFFGSTLQNLLVNFAVSQSRHRRRSQLRGHLLLLCEELRGNKLLARIQALLDSSGNGHLSAARILTEESRSARISLSSAAERFLRRYQRALQEAA